MTTNDRFWVALQIIALIVIVLIITGCAQLPTTEGAQATAQEATKAIREASLYRRCRVMSRGSWVDYYDERPTIACLEDRICALYNNQHEAPQLLPECDVQ